MEKKPEKKPLSAIHLYTAAIERRPIAVYIDNECMGVGVIEEITESFVNIGGEYFRRGVCSFFYATIPLTVLM